MINIDKCKATTSGNLVSFRHTTDLPNGHVFMLGNLIDSERELYELKVPATADLADGEVLIHATPEVMYEAGKNIADFVLKANKEGRGYHLSIGDIFTVTDDCIDGTSAVGKYLVPQNSSTKLAVADDMTGNTRFVAVVIEKTTLGFDAKPATAFRVIKA